MNYKVIVSTSMSSNAIVLVQADEEAKRFFGADDPKTKLFDGPMPHVSYLAYVKEIYSNTLTLTRIYNGEYNVQSNSIPNTYRSVSEFASLEDAARWVDENDLHRLIVGVCPISNVVLWESSRERNFRYVKSRNAFRDIRQHKVWRPFANDISSFFRCEKCDILHHISVRIKIDERYICSDCAMHMGFKRCSHCGTWHNDCATIDNKYVCKCCIPYATFKCDVCGEIHLRGYKFEYAGKRYCMKCYEKYVHNCERCGCKDNLIDVGWGKYLCETCFEKVGSPEFNGTEQMSYHEFSSDSYLAMEKRMPDEVPSTRYFGVELETEGIEFDALDISSFLEDTKVHMEEDGSLSDDGIEFISSPCTLRYHKYGFDWKRFCCRIREADGRSHDTSTCGLHVHVTRKSIPPSVIVKMNVILNKYLPSLSKTIARRDSIYRGDYDPHKTLNVVDGFYKDIPKYISGRLRCWQSMRHYDRYAPINITNRDTVEFRIFRGTTNYETILASIEYCDALIEYSNSINVKDINNKELWHTRQFLEFVKKDEKYRDIIPVLIRLADMYCPKQEVKKLILSYKGIAANETYEQ